MSRFSAWLNIFESTFLWYFENILTWWNNLLCILLLFKHRVQITNTVEIVVLRLTVLKLLTEIDIVLEFLVYVVVFKESYINTRVLVLEQVSLSILVFIRKFTKEFVDINYRAVKEPILISFTLIYHLLEPVHDFCLELLSFALLYHFLVLLYDIVEEHVIFIFLLFSFLGLDGRLTWFSSLFWI